MSSDIPKGVKGAPDWLPPASRAFDAVEQAMLGMAQRFGYERIRTPIFEHTEVFSRGVGASTDIVNKEMYTFDDKGGRSLTLRPEGTAGIMRAALEANVPKAVALPLKVSWVGECFRYERPQSGRQRMFTQVDVEALGSEDPVIDAEIVLLGWEALKAAGVGEIILRINTLGDKGDRGAYNDALNAYLDGFDELPDEVQERRAINPLRAFDSKAPGMAEIMDGAPKVVDHVSDAAAEHYRTVCDLLEAAGLPLTQDPTLVRGLDYYTRTTFEYQVPTLGAQSAVGGGGRYDGLAEDLGYGDRFPGIGLALGVDRTVLAVHGNRPEPDVARVDVFVLPTEPSLFAEAFALATRLRREGIAVDVGTEGRKARAQFKAADRSGARVALVLGPNEVEAGEVTVKDLRSGEQSSVPESDVLASLGALGVGMA